MSLSQQNIPLLYRQNKFDFPNRNPGFNPSHPAASPLQNLSLIFSNAGFPHPIRLDRSGPRATPGSTAATSVMDGVIGPATSFAAASTIYSYTSGFNTTTTAQRPHTIAAIFRTPTSFPSNQTFIFSAITSTSTLVSNFGYNSGATAATFSGFNFTYTFTTNTPYFMIGSGGSVTNSAVIIILNLNTQSIVRSGAGSCTASTSAIATIGIGGDIRTPTQTLNPTVAAIMWSLNTDLDSRQLTRWAADPWIFWYPYGDIDSFSWLQAVQPPALMGQILT